MNFVRTVKAAFAVSSAALMAVGVCLLVWPGVSAAVICMILGVLAIVYGVVRLAGYFCDDLYRLAFQFDLAVGILSILVGCVLLFRSDRVLSALPVVLGTFLLVDSVLRLQTAIDAKHFGMRKWWIILLAAVLGAVLGVLLILRPFAGALDLARLLGLALLLDGGENLLACLYTVKVPRRAAGEEDDDPFSF